MFTVSHSCLSKQYNKTRKHTKWNFIDILIRLAHHENGQGRPTRERPTALAMTSLVVVLLPNVASSVVFSDDIFNHRLSQFLIDLLGSILIRSWRVGIMLEGSNSQEIYVNPNWSSPIGRVVFGVAFHVERSGCG